MNVVQTSFRQYCPGKLIIPRVAPLVMVLVHPILALVTQGIFLLLLSQLQVQALTVTVRNWRTVYGTLIEVTGKAS